MNAPFRISLVALLLCATVLAHGETVARFEQNLGASLPLQAAFVDERGHRATLGDYFGNAPVVMVFGYYHCPRLCSTLMDGVLQVLGDAGLPHVIVAIGIDPRETAQDAARKLAVYRSTEGDDASRLHLLTGKQEEIARLARAAGFRYHYDQDSDQYSHPAGFLVATPDGRISRYFFGLRFDRRDIRLALIEASSQRIGTLVERAQLLCSHYDPLTGRYTVTVMTWVRIFATSSIILLVLGVWLAVCHARRRTRRHPQARSVNVHRDRRHEATSNPAGGSP